MESGRERGSGRLCLYVFLPTFSPLLFYSCLARYLHHFQKSLRRNSNAISANKQQQQPPISLADTELLSYNGADPKKPIYLALNGTIYDVSSAPKTYGPGGSYHFFAGRDAARAFLTGCFADDAVPDLRGVEQMYMPVDPETKDNASPDVIEKAKHRKELSSAERKNRHAQEVRQAKKAVRDGIEGWAKVFRGDTGKPYRKVGEVKREEGWLDKVPVRELCEAAEKQRPVRKYD